MKRATVVLGCVLCLATLSGRSHAGPGDLAPGDLDPTFGTGGLVMVPAGSPIYGALALVRQSDDKVVAVGRGQSSSYPGATILARYLDDGTLDPAFGTAGVVLTPGLGLLGTFPYNMPPTATVQPDDKIVVAGTVAPSGTLAIGVARYLPDGDLDPTFGSGGVVTTSIGTMPVEGVGVAIESDGKIVVAGTANATGGGVFPDPIGLVLVRYLADGSLDSTFGSGGTVVTTFGTRFGQEINAIATAVAVQTDGKVLVAGLESQVLAGLPNESFTMGIVQRYDADGSPDSGFGTGGTLPNVFFTAMVVQPDGNIAGAGFGSLLRLLPAGALDPTFGIGGVAALPLQGLTDGLALQTDGSYVVASQRSDPGAGTGFGVARVRSDGSLDSSFGTNGAVLTLFPAAIASANAVAIEADGKIVVAGGFEVPGEILGFALARYVVTSGPRPVVCAPVGSREFLSRPGPSLTLQHVSTPTNGNLSLRAYFVLPAGVSFSSLDPGTEGARIVVDDAAGTARVDITLPGGAYSGAGTRGWTVSPSHMTWTYKDKTGAAINGVSAMTIRDRSNMDAPGLVRVIAKGKRGTYLLNVPADVPVQATVVLGGPAASLAGACGQSTFSTSDCRLSSDNLLCRIRAGG